MQKNINWDNDPLYFIFEDEVPGFVKMHTKPLDLKDWIKIDKSYLQQMPLRKQFMNKYPNDTFMSLNDTSTELAKEELFDYVIEHLMKYFPELFIFEKNKTGDIIYIQTPLEKVKIDKTIDPLQLLSQILLEDWCIMELDKETNEYKLTAAILCFPMGWSLREKFNKTLGSIHKPVKDFKIHLQENVESIFSSLQVNKPIWRANWFVSNALDGPLDLYTPISHLSAKEERISIFGSNTGKEIVFRAEYQTLRRLPKSNAIVFSIRTYQRYLEEFKEFPKIHSENLIRAIEIMGNNAIEYKGVNRWKDATIQYLTSIINSSRL